MIDANSAALRQHESDQARRENEAPTENELRDYVNYWLEEKAQKMGVEFVMEALVESKAEHQVKLFQAFQKYDMAELGRAVHTAIEAYWRPKAEEEANEHDFAESRRRCQCREICSC